ncbi:hypothetical protein KJ780_03360 [Candidatus Micrarchaeota archaeon]|nr:hypothetical protein [Candidatus Micrarchaeota archaeon]
MKRDMASKPIRIDVKEPSQTCFGFVKTPRGGQRGLWVKTPLVELPRREAPGSIPQISHPGESDSDFARRIEPLRAAAMRRG